jgi:ATP-dependent protease HslVU (ClpYQ) ATPase subunit
MRLNPLKARQRRSGARWLQTVMERVLDEVSFAAAGPPR